MLALDTTPYGPVQIVSGPVLERFTDQGWRLLAAVIDTEFFTQEHSYYDDEACMQKTRHHAGFYPVTRFVVGLDEKSALADKQRELEAERRAKNGLEAQKRELEKRFAEKEAEAHRHKRDLEVCEDTLADAKAVITRMETKYDESQQAKQDLEEMLRAILQDEDVNDAVLAAIAASETPTAKQMISDYMQLRQKLSGDS